MADWENSRRYSKDGDDPVPLEGDADCFIFKPEGEVVDLSSDDDSDHPYQHSITKESKSNNFVESILENEQEEDVVELICIDELNNQEIDPTFEDESSNTVIISLTRSASEQQSDDTETLIISPPCSPNLEGVESVVPKATLPTNLGDIFDTGVLEGQSVQYKNCSKLKGCKETMLRGVIKRNGILCCCSSCKGNEVITPAQFVIHAGSSSKRARENIYLDNGNTLEDAWNEYKKSQFHTTEEGIRIVTGSSTAVKSPTTALNYRDVIPNDMTEVTSISTPCFNSGELNDACSERNDDAVSWQVGFFKL